MKHLYFLAFLVLLVSCHTTGYVEGVPDYLIDLLEDTEDIRFRKPEQVEVILSDCLAEVTHTDNDELWAHYYFVLAHVEMSKGHFDKVLQLVDSVTICTAFAEKYSDKINLVNALVYERLLLYEPSYEHFRQLARLERSVKLTNDEKLIALLGKARIEFWLLSDYTSTYHEAKDFVDEHPDIDIGLYYSNAALFDTKDKRFEHLRKSEQYALAEQCHYQLLQRYVQHAAYTQEQDSIDYYLALAMQCLEEHSLHSMYKNTYLA